MKGKVPTSEIILADPGGREGTVVRRVEMGGPRYFAGGEQIRLLWSQRAFLFKITAYAFLIATVFAFLIPSRYTSTARLMPPDSGSTSGLGALASMFAGGGGTGAGLGEIAGDLMGMKSSSDIFVGILESRTAEDKLIQQYDLRKVYWDREMESARRDLKARTSVEVDRKSQIITISVTDRSPKRAAAMAQSYVDELDLLVTQLSTSAARRERIFLEERLKQVNGDLEKAERDFSQFASRNTTIDIKEQGKAMVDAAAQLEGELIATQSELQGLKQIYTDNNVRVRSLTARVAELESQLEKLGGKAGVAPANPSDSSDQLASMFPSIRQLPLIGVRYADLYRQSMVQEAVFETLTKQYELAKVQEAKEIPTVKVLDSPNIPEKKSFPPRLLIILLSTTLAFVGGATWIFAKESWRHADPEDPRRVVAEEMALAIRTRVPWAFRNGGTNGRVDVRTDHGESTREDQARLK